MHKLAKAQEGPQPHTDARKIFELIATEMELVEAEYGLQVRSDVQVVEYLGEYLRSSGGKRVRPALLILSSYAAGGGGDSKSVVRMATVMEMLHTATLVHDDIIDKSDIRRGRPSVNAKFGNQSAVLMGDWLYMSAFETALEERSLRILEILTNLTRRMTEGELLQLTMIGNGDITPEEYFDILRRKTAYLFAACCEIPAILAGAGETVGSALKNYGMNLGIAFQLADDLLDFTASEDALGKVVGADLQDGKITLPMIVLMEADPGTRLTINKIIADGRYDQNTKQLLTAKFHKYSIGEKIRAKAQEYAELARKNLAVLPETEYRSALDGICDFVIARNA